jgi:signal peptidase I
MAPNTETTDTETSAEPEADKDAGEDQPEERKRRSFWKELPVLIIIAFAVALLVKTFALQAFYIPSASMEPTLVEGDRVLVQKVGYWWGEPARGQVVVFEREIAVPEVVPGSEQEEGGNVFSDIASAFRELFGFPTGGEQDFIKRVMAVEGDTIEGRNGGVYVNDERVDEPWLEPGDGTAEFAPIEVPDETIFVMGDNRNNSDDSRNFGPIPEDSVVGHAFVLIWPPADFGLL